MFRTPGQKLVFHVKVYKAGRVFGELVIQGETNVRCRDCGRWHVVIVGDKVDIYEQKDTSELPT